MITAPFESLDGWVAYLSQTELPVLRRTAGELAALALEEENVSERSIAGVVLRDPLMTLKVLAYIEAHRRRSQNADITTIGHAILMLGVSPFFRSFSALKTVEDRLAEHPKALLGVLRTVKRARDAARYAQDWAVLRHDLDVNEITVAALLYDSAEMLLWCFAPELLLRIRVLQCENPHLRSRDAQRQVLGVTGRDLQLALARAWHLPELLQNLMNDQLADHPRVRNVTLAVNLARHAANGWDDPALPDDLRDLGDLLHMPADWVMERVGHPAAPQPH